MKTENTSYPEIQKELGYNFRYNCNYFERNDNHMKLIIFTIVLLVFFLFFLVPGVNAGLMKNTGLPDYSAVQFTMRADPLGNFTNAQTPSSHITNTVHPDYYDEIIAKARAASGMDTSFGGQYAQGTVFVRFTASVQEGNDRVDTDVASIYYDPEHAGEALRDYWNDVARTTTYDDSTYLSGYITKFAKAFQYQSGMTL